MPSFLRGLATVLVFLMLLVGVQVLVEICVETTLIAFVDLEAAFLVFGIGKF